MASKFPKLSPRHQTCLRALRLFEPRDLRRWFGRLTSATMSKRISRNFPAMMTQLTLSSWETIYHRSLMMAQGTLSAAEYQRMFVEKAAAAQASTLALMSGQGHAAVVAPYLVRSRANARRLRRK